MYGNDFGNGAGNTRHWGVGQQGTNYYGSTMEAVEQERKERLKKHLKERRAASRKVGYRPSCRS